MTSDGAPIVLLLADAAYASGSYAERGRRLSRLLVRGARPRAEFIGDCS